MSTNDKRIAALQPGQSVRISGDAACYVTAERSGDGRTLRYVRHTGRGFVVFHSTPF